MFRITRTLANQGCLTPEVEVAEFLCVSKLHPETKKICVWGRDTLTLLQIYWFWHSQPAFPPPALTACESVIWLRLCNTPLRHHPETSHVFPRLHLDQQMSWLTSKEPPCTLSLSLSLMPQRHMPVHAYTGPRAHTCTMSHDLCQQLKQIPHTENHSNRHTSHQHVYLVLDSPQLQWRLHSLRALKACFIVTWSNYEWIKKKTKTTVHVTYNKKFNIHTILHYSIMRIITFQYKVSNLHNMWVQILGLFYVATVNLNSPFGRGTGTLGCSCLPLWLRTVAHCKQNNSWLITLWSKLLNS